MEKVRVDANPTRRPLRTVQIRVARRLRREGTTRESRTPCSNRRRGGESLKRGEGTVGVTVERVWFEVVSSLVAEPPMFGERRGRGKLLVAPATPNLLSTVGVHSLVSAEVGKLGVRFQTDLTAKGLDAAVDVLVLFEAAGRGKGLAAVRAGVAAGTRVRRADVALQVAWVREGLVARLAGEG